MGRDWRELQHHEIPAKEDELVPAHITFICRTISFEYTTTVGCTARTCDVGHGIVLHEVPEVVSVIDALEESSQPGY